MRQLNIKVEVFKEGDLYVTVCPSLQYEHCRHIQSEIF